MDAIELVTRADVEQAPIASVREAFEVLECATEGIEDTGARALVAGFRADRLGYAFLGGYEAALARLVAPRPHERACLAATEENGAHPRAIQTRLARDGDAWTLTGEKTFATLATESELLYVVASEGERDGRNALRLACVRANAPGVTIKPRPQIPFAPEIPHARVTLSGARVSADELLPGDGYAAYLKPFRTIEDTHVFLSVLGFLVRVARVIAREDVAGPLSVHARALLPIASADPNAPETHLALAGVIDAVRAELPSFPWTSVHEETRARWARDEPLLWVAETARKKRTEAALASTREKPTGKSPS